MDNSSYLWYIKVEGILQLTLKTQIKMARKKYEAGELYVQIIKNVQNMLEKEKDWLEGGGCSDKVAQHRLVSNLEST
jgi:hypothetical protein